MSVNKLLTRIVAPKMDLNACSDVDQQAAFLHDHTCGITSDPLTQFAVVLSALIHDLDHPGVSNGQLIKEDPKLAVRYKEKSVAEQNSVDLAWNVLMSPAYDQLRAAIFSTETELCRFRNLLVNSIIATDIFDKELGMLRKNRWNKAFYETEPDDSSREAKSRKATIVIEHLIQASDVAHTMQHWHVYQKWNQRLFDEMMMAYRDGRSDKDPSLGWYQGELWFFDNYVIPLTKKLKDCGVFGVSSDEYLNYAMHNRGEWASKGQNVVQQYLEEFERKVQEESIVKAQSSRVQI
jgi:3'5'-cyclic nucleotide phosphodiesterase